MTDHPFPPTTFSAPTGPLGPGRPGLPPDERQQWLQLRLGLLLRPEISWSLKLTLAEALARAAAAIPAQDQPGSVCSRALTVALAEHPIKVQRRVRRALEGAAGDVEREVRRAEDSDVDILIPEDRDFPVRLLDLAQPPVLIYARRCSPIHTRHSIGIVGPRNADPYGIDTASGFASDFATAGVCVVSGFARGVDIASHRATYHLGPTWAVLGCGVDVRYPRQHHRDADCVVEHGGWVLSEFPLREAPQPWHFPLRNRLIAALSDSLLVVQASERSGSLITAHAALELGRDVWAVPGRVDHPRSRGTNRLIRDGANVALESRDLLETLPSHRLPVDEEAGEPPAPAGVSQLAGRIHQLLCQGPSDLEVLQRTVGEPVANLLAALGELEIEGYVQRRGAGTYALRPRGS